MVTAGKIFKLPEDAGLEQIALKLKNFVEEEKVEVNDKEISLVTEIEDFLPDQNSLKGVFSWDELINISHRGETIPVPRTFYAPFIFFKQIRSRPEGESIYKDRILLTILEKKNRANNIANRLSKILFISVGKIVEAKIEPEVLKGFHEQNFEDTKIVFFDDVDLPNINKLSLYGSSLGNTSLYDGYCDHGKIWYAVIKSKKYGYIVGVTRNCVVTIFSKVNHEEFMDYVREEIYDLI
jgi:hypothetical protein